MGERGISIIDFESGVIRSVDAHVRTVVRTGLQQVTNEISERNIELIGHCYVETSAHGGARPDHEAWQGQQFYWREKDTSGDNNSAGLPDFVAATQYGSGAGLGGWNCRHSYYAFFPGVSRPKYTQDQLRHLNQPDVDYGGKRYSAYDATQRQRQLEREMRATKRKIIGYEAAGDTEMMTVQAVRLRRQRENYIAFSEAANLRPKSDRSMAFGYNRSISSKAVWQRRKAEKSPFLMDIIDKPWTDRFKRKAMSTYRAFEKEGCIMDSHFIARYLQRKNKSGCPEVSVEDVVRAIRSGNNYTRGDRAIYFDPIKEFAAIQNAENDEFISFIRRNEPKKEWT